VCLLHTTTGLPALDLLRKSPSYLIRCDTGCQPVTRSPHSNPKHAGPLFYKARIRRSSQKSTVPLRDSDLSHPYALSFAERLGGCLLDRPCRGGGETAKTRECARFRGCRDCIQRPDGDAAHTNQVDSDSPRAPGGHGYGKSLRVSMRTRAPGVRAESIQQSESGCPCSIPPCGLITQPPRPTSGDSGLVPLYGADEVDERMRVEPRDLRESLADPRTNPVLAVRSRRDLSLHPDAADAGIRRRNGP
jgi:hypothetical protein